MTFQEYLDLSSKTLSEQFHIAPDDTYKQKLLHAVIGLSTESNELLDTLKKHVYYGKPLDVVNIKEEIGDIFWYVAILFRELDLDLDNILHDNIEKLRKRYGEKFSTTSALNRDTDNELSHITL